MAFIASLVQSLAWPITLLVVLWWFREHLSFWFSKRPLEVRLGMFQVRWAEDLDKIESELEAVGATEKQFDESQIPTTLRKLIRIDPDAAILKAYMEMERVLVAGIASHFGGEVPKRGAVQLARQAKSDNLISKETLFAIDGVSTLRNEVAHGRESIGAREATRYVEVVNGLTSTLEDELTAAKDKEMSRELYF